MGDYMNTGKNIWTWWQDRPTLQEMQEYKINELYIDIDSFEKPTTGQLKEYIELCYRNNTLPYIMINCYASDVHINNTIKEVKDYVRDKIDYATKLGSHVVLDYIRSGGYTNLKPTQKDINELLDYAKQKDMLAKASIFPYYSAFKYNQSYKEFSKRVTICPMLYGIGFLTKLSIVLHKLFFPKCVPCLQAWDTTLEELQSQEALIPDGNYTIWKFPDWKKIVH
jgi:hypothetical protein